MIKRLVPYIYIYIGEIYAKHMERRTLLKYPLFHINPLAREESM